MRHSLLKTVYFSILSLCCLSTTIQSARATWYNENIEPDSDIMMMDVRWPFWGEATYYANFNFNLNNKEVSIGGYGGYGMGIVSLEPDHRPELDPVLNGFVRAASTWSLWGTSKTGESPIFVDCSPYIHPTQEVGEGATCSGGTPVWPFIKNNHWYTTLMRVWQPTGVVNPQYCYLGRWIRDVDENKWYLYGVIRIPIPATGFTANAGFLEDAGGGGRSSRSMYRRLGYCRKDGKWIKSNATSFPVGAYKGKYDTYWVINTVSEGDHEYLAMELSGDKNRVPVFLKGEPLELGKTHLITVKQPDQPTLTPPAAAVDVKAQANGKQVVVSWDIAQSASPQLGYRIELFDNGACEGAPKVVAEKRMPTEQMVLLNSTLEHPTVRLTITDIFDQVAKPVIVKAVSSATPTYATNVSVTPGLEYELFFKDTQRHENVLLPKGSTEASGLREQHYWVALSELKDGKHIQSGVARGLDSSFRGTKTEGYAFKFNGFLNAPTTGLYLLHVKGSDGYRIHLDGKDALTWDGLHGPAEKTVVLNLAKGNHALAVDYFVDKNEPGVGVKMEWEGIGLPRQEVPDSALFCVGEGNPKINMTASASSDGTGNIKVKVDAQGHKIEKIILFLGKHQLAESKPSALEFDYSGLLFDGNNPVWARLVYDQDHTMDYPIQKIEVTSHDIKDWEVGVAGNASDLHGLVQTGADSFSFFGEGEYVVSKKIKGDFTLTCRIDAYGGEHDEPVSPYAWVGLTAREYPSKNNFGWGNEFGIMQTGGCGLKTSADFSDAGSSRMNSYASPHTPAHPWLRVVRQGNAWTAYSSVDGKTWDQDANHFKPLNNEVGAGLVFRGSMINGQAYFSTKVSHLKLEPGLAKDMVIPMPPMAKDTDGVRLTGVVMSRSNPSVVVVRSSDNGLLRSKDGGGSWTPIGNSALEPIPLVALGIKVMPSLVS